jgi:hypothetical protein
MDKAHYAEKCSGVDSASLNAANPARRMHAVLGGKAGEIDERHIRLLCIQQRTLHGNCIQAIAHCVIERMRLGIVPSGHEDECDGTLSPCLPFDVTHHRLSNSLPAVVRVNDQFGQFSIWNRITQAREKPEAGETDDVSINSGNKWRFKVSVGFNMCRDVGYRSSHIIKCCIQLKNCRCIIGDSAANGNLHEDYLLR